MRDHTNICMIAPNGIWFLIEIFVHIIVYDHMKGDVLHYKVCIHAIGYDLHYK